MLFSGLYADFYSTSKMRNTWSDEKLVERWILIEQAIAKVQASLGIIPKEAYKEIEKLSLKMVDNTQLIEDMRRVGRPIVGLLNQLKKKLSPKSSPYLHYGASTQDIIDTSIMLAVKESIDLLEADIDQIINSLLSLEKENTDTLIVGRTNGQHALPIKLSYKLRLWRKEIERRKIVASECRNRLWLQFGGPVGDLTQFKDKSQNMQKYLARNLGLVYLEDNWQSTRDGMVDIISSIGSLAGTLCKISRNINLLSSSDIGELEEKWCEGKGVSSSMNHKRNQRSSEFGEAVARLARQRAESIGELNFQLNERHGGVWISEWAIVPETFLYCSGALEWAKKMFASIQVNEGRLNENILNYQNKLRSHSVL